VDVAPYESRLSTLKRLSPLSGAIIPIRSKTKGRSDEWYLSVPGVTSALPHDETVMVHHVIRARWAACPEGYKIAFICTERKGMHLFMDFKRISTSKE